MRFKPAVPRLNTLPLAGRLLVGLVLLACCGFAVWNSAMAGISDLNATEAGYLVNLRIEQNRPIDVATLDRAQAALETAIEWNPQNGVAYRNLALVHQMRLSLPLRDLVERDRHLNASVAAAARAVALQPTSGYNYSVYAIAKLLRGERDASFRQSLALAAKYGPWEPGVQVNIIDTGLRAWIDLDASARDVVRQTIGRALQSQPEKAAAALQARRAWLPDCKELGARIPALCA